MSKAEVTQKSLEVGGEGWGLGQTLSQKGLCVDGCVVLQGDTTALGTEVVSGDNAHGDNQQGPGRRGPGHCGLGTASETALPTGDPYQCRPSTQDVHPGCAGRRGPCKVAGRALRRWGGDSLQALHRAGTRKAPRSTGLPHAHFPS